MKTPEFSGFIENTYEKTAEAAGVVFESFKPTLELFWDLAVLKMFTHPKLHRIFRRSIFRAYNRQEERREKYSLAVVV